jgi:hypothetical protein
VHLITQKGRVISFRLINKCEYHGNLTYMFESMKSMFVPCKPNISCSHYWIEDDSSQIAM